MGIVSEGDVFGKQAKPLFAEFLLISLLFFPPPELEDNQENCVFSSVIFLPWLRLFKVSWRVSY